ncbi:MAG: AbrB protein [Synergistetes bacterium HGW-Synergistetes-2]|nr:MAG: AbrB protein [Synergistetes bacterium HGW-Synergistetes-2]
MTAFLLLFSVGIAGYLVFEKFALPVPAILGPLFFVSLLNLSGFFPEVQLQWISRYSNIVIGSYVGLRVNKQSLTLLRELPVPALVVSLSMLFLSLAGGSVLYMMSDLSMKTAFLGSTTGGIAEMALLSMSMGADVASVTLLQVFRMLSAILATPLVCRKWTQWFGSGGTRRVSSSPSSHSVEAQFSDEEEAVALESSVAPSAKGYALLAVVSLIGGILGYVFRLPVGILTGAMLAVAATSLLRGELPPMPNILRTVAQIGIGIIIASNITISTLHQFAELWLPVVALTAVLLVCSVLLAVLLHRMTGWDYPTCLLSSSLGGLSQMSIISEEMGADPLKVSILQTIRLLSILIVLPFLFSFLFGA